MLAIENKGGVSWGPFAAPYEHTVPKLAAAATYAAPVDASDGDVKALQRLGYRDVEDVGRRILAHNARVGHLEYPVPLGYDFNREDPAADLPFSSGLRHSLATHPIGHPSR